jgi:myosin heavy subunit
MMRRTTALLLASLAWLGAFGSLAAQDPTTPLSRQQLANQKFDELTESMQRVRTLLAKSDPDDPDGKLIDTATLFVQERKIREAMEIAGMMLREEEWDDALDKMKGVRSDLKQLLDLLQNRNTDLQKLLERLQQLEGFRQEVDQLVEQQAEHKADSARAEDLQRQLENIAKARSKAEQLMQQQQQVRQATNELGLQATAEATRKLSDQESELQARTDKLAEDIAKLEEKDEQLRSESESKQPSPSQSSKPGSSKGSKAAKGAAQSMQKAQQQLGQQQAEPSLKDQDQAIENLQQTMAELDELAESARRELDKLPFEQMAKRQEQTQKATDTLSKKMEDAEEGEGNEEGEATPGRQSVQQSVPKQRAAAGQLKEFKPAKQEQQDAKEDLERAREELDEAIAQLRQQLQDEVLRALEERFTAMLARQRELSLQTRTLDQTRQQVLTADGSLPTALAERIQVVAEGEGDLEVEAADALKLLAEEGTTAVFPEIVAELREQLQRVTRRCRSNETGDRVQEQQQEIEDTLELLINSLRKTIERREGG